MSFFKFNDFMKTMITIYKCRLINLGSKLLSKNNEEIKLKFHSHKCDRAWKFTITKYYNNILKVYTELIIVYLYKKYIE